MKNGEIVEIESEIAALRSRLARLDEDSSRRRRRSSGRTRLVLAAVLCAVPAAAYAAYITVPHTFVNGTVADAGEVNANFAVLETESNDQDARLGTVESDMAGLQADLAQLNSALVPGAVMLFNLSSCPTGWSPLAGAGGRAIVGGAAGGTVGAALSNLEDRTHNHTLDPPTASTSVNSQPHTHFVDPPSASTQSSGSHNHQWSNFDQFTGLVWRSFNATGSQVIIVNWDNGIGNEGSGHFPLSRGGPGYVTYYTDIEGDHSHTLDIPGFSSDWNSTTAHAHDFDLGGAASSAATTSSVMPYVQLLVCRKN